MAQYIKYPSNPISIPNPLPVSGPLTDAQLRATAVPVSGTFWQATQPVSGTVAATQSGTWSISNLFALDTTVSTMSAKLPAALGAQTIAGSLAVNIASDQTVPVSGTFWQATQPVSIASSVAVTGPLTDTELRATPVPVSGTVTANTGLSQPLTDTQLRATAVPVSGTFWQATQPVSGTVAATQSGTWNITNISGTVSLPTGAATETTLSSLNGKVTAVNTGAVTISTALPAGTNTIGYIKKAGLAKSNTPVYNAYASTSVTTSAYVQLIASTTAEADMVHVFDSSGQAMILAVGGAGSEVDQLYIPPGGGDFNLAIAASSRVSIKALTATASSGYIILNLLG